MEDVRLSVSEFVGLLNQSLEGAFPSVLIVGELANFRISKNRWVYFDLKDDTASVKFFGTVYQLSGPLEDGLMLQVRGLPRLHPLYGFSVTVQFMQPVGEGSLKKAAALLEAKLTAEGLFAPERKRPLPYPPRRVGLITSGESAAYHDFIKVSQQRWHGLEIQLADVQVQGDLAPAQLVAAIEYFNSQAEPVDVLVITRGGGSAEDLAAFSSEVVTRAVAASRIPTLVAIGHEVDISLAELAADQRASTPSNAAELLLPDRTREQAELQLRRRHLEEVWQHVVAGERQRLERVQQTMAAALQHLQRAIRLKLDLQRDLLRALSPQAALQRGYAIIRHDGRVVRSGKSLAAKASLNLELHDATLDAVVTKVTLKKL